MRPLLQVIPTAHTPESLVENLRGEAGIILLRTAQFDLPSARYSFVTARPFLTFRSFGSRCEVTPHTFSPNSHLQSPASILGSPQSSLLLSRWAGGVTWGEFQRGRGGMRWFDRSERCR